MGQIKVLPEIIANKIAAGEVVERPASVVKEMIENALDAGARSIEVTIEHGGKSLIRIADDGSGMDAQDAELAFQRHATSKIYQASDLDAIDSYGFRGEALASISAVSRTTLTTRAKGRTSGVEVKIEGGHKTSVREAPCREGTIVEIRDLFFNTPARRKFMKGDSTELGHIVDTVGHIALATLEAGFVLKSGDRTLLDLMPGQDIRARAASVYGEEQASHFIEFKGEGNHAKVWGVAGKPFAAKGNRTGQVLFVNRRLIKSQSLSYALLAGYHGALMHGQYPIAVVFIEIDPAKVDVNVHPTKQEVRISNEAEVRSILSQAVAQALQSSGDLAPSVKLRKDPGVFAPLQSKSFEPRTVLPSAPGYPKQESLVTIEPVVRSQEPAVYHMPERQAAEADPIEIRGGKFHVTKILGQIHHTFIVAETEEGMMIVDQHAAHERIMYETLLKEIRSGGAQKQGLLVEEMLTLHPRQLEVFRTAQPLLEKMGFEAEEFGENTVVIRAYPAILQDEAPGEALKHFLEEKEDEKSKTRLEDIDEEVAALFACKRKSVKAHDSLAPEKLKSLLVRLAVCENPFHCPHGRPTFFKQTFSELERQFKRK